MQKTRLDIALVERGMVGSRSLAQRLVMAGKVRVNGQLAHKPAQKISPSDVLEIKAGAKFVSRGGEKLEAALQTFEIPVKGKVCADVGASTGGFTDCLLQHGAQRVYAIDVGHGILEWKLRNDKRVRVMERVNARYLNQLPEPVQIVTIDVSFISLKRILPVIQAWFDPHLFHENIVIPLIKPQFEAGKSEVKRGKGVIKDPHIHQQVLMDILTFAKENDFGIQGLIRSPITGPKGNVEFLAYLTFPAEDGISIPHLISQVIDIN